MKIKLLAFGSKLQSSIMEVPEETGQYFTMVLTQPFVNIRDYGGKTIAKEDSFEAHCTFRWNGMYDFDIRGCRIYELVDIKRLGKLG